MDNEIMEGFVISSFIICGLGIIAWCIKGECKKPVMRQSPSNENLKDIVGTSEDPQQIV